MHWSFDVPLDLEIDEIGFFFFEIRDRQVGVVLDFQDISQNDGEYFKMIPP